MIRTFFTITILLISSSFASISFEKDYKEAIKKSKSLNKPLFVMVSSPTCPECNYMKKEIFTQSDVSSLVNSKYVSFDFNIDDKDIPKNMQFWGIPRFYILKDGKTIYKKKMGGMKKDQFIKLIGDSK